MLLKERTRIEICRTGSHKTRRPFFAKVYLGDTLVDACAHESDNSEVARRRAEEWTASERGQYRIKIVASKKCRTDVNT